MTRIFLAFLSLLLLAACSPDPSIAVSTAVAGTMEAQVIATGVAATQEAAFTPTPPPELLCEEIAEDYLAQVDDTLDVWRDAISIADSTPRMSLAGPMAELQEIKRAFSNLDAPPCARRVKTPLLSHMEHVIEGYLLFMQQEPDSRVASEFTAAGEELDSYFGARERIHDEVVEATREALFELTREAEGTPTD